MTRRDGKMKIITITLFLFCAIFEPDSSQGEQGRISDEYLAKLESVVIQNKGSGLVMKEGESYVYRYHTQVFKIHGQSKQGVFAGEPHDEEGPNIDGILLRVTPRIGPYGGQFVVPQAFTLPYWTAFINAYPVSADMHLFLYIAYGKKADKNLVEAFKTCFGPVVPPQTGDRGRWPETKLP